MAVLVIPRKQWLRPHMTEKLLTGMLSINTKDSWTFEVTFVKTSQYLTNSSNKNIKTSSFRAVKTFKRKRVGQIDIQIALFLSGLFGNPEDRFSLNEAHFRQLVITCKHIVFSFVCSFLISFPTCIHAISCRLKFV